MADQTKTLHLPVRVDALRHDAPVFADVVHREAGPAPVAALVPLGVAGHELLLRQRLERVPHEVPRALEAPGGAEGPARTAVRLPSDTKTKGRRQKEGRENIDARGVRGRGGRGVERLPAHVFFLMVR